MSLDPFAIAPIVGLIRASPLVGQGLINGTQTFLTWTAPNDGQLHWAMAFGSLQVAVGQTGGVINFSVQIPSGGTANDAIFAGGQGAGNYMAFGPAAVVQPGGLVTINQATAMTLGTATGWFGIWGS